MKRLFNKILCVFVVAVAVVLMGLISTLAQPVYASTVADNSAIWYIISDYSAKIVACDPSVSGHLTIPETLSGYPVVIIDDEAFINCVNLTGVTIPDTVTSINYAAFEGCTGLKSVYIGSGLETIGIFAFNGCGALEKIEVAAGNKVFHSNGNCLIHTARKELTVGCTTSQIPNDGSVTQIRRDSFRGRTGLTSITIPESIRYIGECAFAGCDNLEEINFNAINASTWNTAGGILGTAGKNTEGITVIIGPNVTHISDGIFYSGNIDSLRSNISTVNFTEGSDLTIGENAFRGCIKLTEVNCTERILSIGKYAFFECERLEKFSIPERVTTIGEYAFAKCAALKNISISTSVKRIGEYAFAECIALEKISIPSNVDQLGESAFKGCSGLLEAEIDCFEIGDYAFDNCTKLHSVFLGKRVYFSSDATHYIFYGCESLSNLQVDNEHSYLYSAGNCIIYGKGISSVVIGCKDSTIPTDDSVNRISETAFAGCTTLTQIVIPDNIKYISDRAFDDCTGLTEVTIPKNVKQIGSRAFAGCSQLKTITFEGSAPTIKFNAFENLTANAEYYPDASWTSENRLDYGGNLTWVALKLPECVTNPELHIYSDNCDESCNICGTVRIAIHNYSNATCTLPKTCQDCGVTEGAAQGHNYSSATCTLPKTCKNCGETVGSPVGHSYVTKVIEPTCASEGYTAHTCACGDNYKDTFVAATGHTYVPTVVKPAPGKEGYTLHTCHCGDSYKDTYVAALDVSVPKVTITVDAATGKPALSWAHGGEGVTYEIHRATKKTGTYTKVATVATSNWSDTSVSVGKTYYYKVKAVYVADTSFNSDFSAVVSFTTKCATPVIAVSNNSSGKPVVSWSKVTGAKQYTVYVATSQNGTYKKLGTTKSTTYTDSKAKAGTTYFYKVIANASKSTYNSGYSNIVSCGMICGTPSVTVKIDANTGKPSLSWKKVDGATKYAIYRDGELLTTTTAVTYADTGAAIDTQYTYTVQALGKTEDLNGNPSKAVTATSGIAKPTIKGSIDAVSGKPVLTWDAIEGAVKYEVYRSTKSNKSYVLIDTVEGCSYTDESVSAGKTYYYQVKAIGQVSKSALSTYDKLTGKCATPAITVESNAKAQPVISWEKVSGAKKYTVYRSTSETSGYKSIGTSKTTSYTDTKATPGRVYYYKVIANASSSKYNSGYSNIVSCGVNCATPVVKVSNNANGKTVLTWSKVTGATKYEIYLLGAEDYVTLATVTGTTWTDADGVVGDGRYYGIRAIASAAEFSSEVSEAVFGKAIPATPKVSGKVGANKKPVLTWGEVEGATKYIVYRSTKKDKGYTVIGESEVLTYEDLTAAKGKTYYYKVVAVGDGVQSAQSSYAKVKSK